MNSSIGQKTALTWRGPGAPLCFQIALTCTQIWWTTEVGLAFARLEEGYENAVKDYNKKQVCPAHLRVRPSTLLCEAPACASATPESKAAKYWQQLFCPRVTASEIHDFNSLFRFDFLTDSWLEI